MSEPIVPPLACCNKPPPGCGWCAACKTARYGSTWWLLKFDAAGITVTKENLELAREVLTKKRIRP